MPFPKAIEQYTPPPAAIIKAILFVNNIIGMERLIAAKPEAPCVLAINIPSTIICIDTINIPTILGTANLKNNLLTFLLSNSLLISLTFSIIKEKDNLKAGIPLKLSFP